MADPSFGELSSDRSSSSSLSGLGRFFVAGFVVLRVVCTIFFGAAAFAALGAFAAAFFGAAFAFGFCRWGIMFSDVHLRKNKGSVLEREGGVEGEGGGKALRALYLEGVEKGRKITYSSYNRRKALRVTVFVKHRVLHD